MTKIICERSLLSPYVIPLNLYLDSMEEFAESAAYVVYVEPISIVPPFITSSPFNVNIPPMNTLLLT